MKTVVCKFDLFNLHQNIYVTDENDMRLAAISNLDNLGDDIAMICDKEDVNSVHLFGSKSYSSAIIEQINKTNLIKYNNRQVEVKVNE